VEVAWGRGVQEFKEFKEFKERSQEPESRMQEARSPALPSL
jgi:hypothetical protein